MKMKSTVLFLLTVTLLSCNQHKDGEKQNPSSPEPEKGKALSEFSYAQVNENILKPKCLACHSGKSEPLLTSYKDVFANKDSIYKEAIVTREMPKKTPLTEQEISDLKKWLDAGALENAEVVVQQPEPSAPAKPENPQEEQVFEIQRPVLWEKVKRKIFDKNCVSCHFAGNTDGISSYEDYETVKATVGTIFYSISIQPYMPPPPKDLPEDQPNPNQLTSYQKDLLSAWVNDGMKQ